MILRVRFLICSLLLLSGLAQVANADTLLRWKFAAREQLRVTVDQHTVTETTGAGKPTGIDIKMQLQMAWAVDSVDADGTAKITQIFDRFVIAMKSGTSETIEYDSDSEIKPSGSAADIAAAVEPVIGVEFVVTVTNRGAITAVELSEAATEAFASVKSPALKQLFSAEGISQLLGQSAVELPEEAVMPASHWKAELSTQSPLGTLEQAKTYTVAAPEEIDGKTLQKIDITGQLNIKATEPSSSKLKLVDQELSGVLKFDAEAGRLVRSESKQMLITERPYREFKIRVTTTAITTTTISSQ